MFQIADTCSYSLSVPALAPVLGMEVVLTLTSLGSRGMDLCMCVYTCAHLCVCVHTCHPSCLPRFSTAYLVQCDSTV